MKRAAILFFVLGAVACSGNYSTGTQPNPIPPAGSIAPAAVNASATPAPKSSNVAESPGVGNAIYPLADAPNGFACPQTADGYSCELRFNVNPSASSSPSASPSPQPTATSSLGPSALPSGLPGPTIALHASALPKDAPRMVHPPANALNVIPLMLVSMSTTADFPLDGAAIAKFTLPKEQIGGRGFALQLFVQRMQGKTKSWAQVLSLEKASLQKNVLSFGFVPPKITVAKNTTYVLALYGIEISHGSAPPSTPPSTKPTALPPL